MDVEVPEELIQELLDTSDSAPNADTMFDVGDCNQVLAALDAHH